MVLTCDLKDLAIWVIFHNKEMVGFSIKIIPVVLHWMGMLMV